MKRSLVLAGGLVAFSLLFARPAAADVNVGDKPDLSFKAADGTRVDLAKLRGKIVVVDFWATWCGPCMAEAEHMVAFNKKYAAKGVVMIGISLDDDREKMISVAKEKGFTWPMYFDGLVWENKISGEWGVKSIPCTFMISPDGEVLWRGHPAEGLDESVWKALKEHPPRMVEPEVLDAATALLDKADTAIKGSKPEEAAKLVGQVPANAHLDSKFGARLSAMQTELTAYGKAALAEAKSLVEKKEFSAAGDKFALLAAAFGDTPLGKDAADALAELKKNPEARASIESQQRQAKAQSLLEAGRKLKADGRNEEAYNTLKAIVSDYAGSPAAKEASQLVAAYDSNPAFVEKAADAEAGAKARSLIGVAESYLKAGLAEQAKEKYQQVVDLFPKSSYARAARAALAKLAD